MNFVKNDMTMKKTIELPQEWPGIHYIGQEEIDAVTRVLKAQSPFRYYGPDLQKETENFEKEFAEFIGKKYCLGVASGSTALQVALSALGVGIGDEVALPGYFWVSTVSAIIRSGAVPKLIDVDESFNLDPQDLKQKITDRTKAVILVPMGGVLGQLDEIRDICTNNNIPLLEDCAQSLGASRFGKRAGSYGDMSVFSFQINKNMTAGEGGAVLTDDHSLYLKSIAAHDLGYPKDPNGKILFDEQYQGWGIGCRMTEITAAMLRQQLKKLPRIIKAMGDFKNELKDQLKSCKGIKTRKVDDPSGDSGGFLKMIFDDPEKSFQFKEKLFEYGIKLKHDAYYPIHMTEWGLHIYYNLPSLVNKRPFSGGYSVWQLKENEFAKDYTYDKGTLPKLDDYVNRTMLFCIASILSVEEKAFIKDVFDKCCKDLDLY